ncbi:MAG: class I SAM-dependent methyltransferase [Ruthenibacterium sp.]
MPLHNKLPQLDARLAAAAAYVRRGCRVADIGCDHGKLSVYLAANRICEKVIACDICEKPLAHAARNLTLHGCIPQYAECRLGSGFSVIAENEADDFVLAGISGVTIAAILENAPQFWREQYRFIFVPSAKPDMLRRFLAQHGFALLDETPVEAAGRFYTVLHAQYTGEKQTPTPLFCAIGLCEKPTDAAIGYLLKVQKQMEKQNEPALAAAIEERVEKCRILHRLPNF